MKEALLKTFLFSVLVLLPNVVFAQFSITPEGLTTDDGKDYIIISVEGKDKATLYQDALRHLTKTYVSAKDVISPVENEMISVNGLFDAPDGIFTYQVNYTLNLEFRDGRIKYSLPCINYMKSYFDGREYELTYNESNGGFGSVVLVGIFSKKGKLKREKPKYYIESFFNTGFNSLKESLSKTEDDW